jgi:NAD(P)-dependent dehydrogenase (short-subunit alcohol dehydrogenase family)
MESKPSAPPVRELAGRTAIVTGAGRGIGASCAVQLAQLGARVVVAARTEEQVMKVAGFISECGGEALPVVVDLTSPPAIELLFREARERLGPVDILVNNAAVVRAGPFHEQSPGDWSEMLALNVDALLRCSRLALDDMVPRRRGVIVNLASVSGVAGVEKLPGLAAYAATKGAVLAFSEALAAEVRRHGVRVVSVSPGGVRTDMLAQVAPDAVESAMHPGRIAEVVGFLASDRASGVTQTNLVVWGPPPAGQP